MINGSSITVEKKIVATGKMSNLVGMWAFIWKGEEIKYIVFVYGKADDSNYIIQWISPLTGEPNVCKIVSIEQMKDWTFIPTKELVNEMRSDILDKKRNRYKIEL